MNKTLSAAISSPSPFSSSDSSEAASSSSAQSKPQVSQGGSRLDTPLYTLLPLDLRIKKDLQAQAQENDPLDALSTLLDPELPTLFLAECVYCYMQPEESGRVIEWFAAKFKGKGGCLGVVYEMCGLEWVSILFCLSDAAVMDGSLILLNFD
jgi:[phosphatase 2A protein]-leucine-carboxy methyltransferase